MPMTSSRTGHLLPRLRVRRSCGLVTHPLRQRQPRHGVHRHQEERRRDHLVAHLFVALAFTTT